MLGNINYLIMLQIQFVFFLRSGAKMSKQMKLIMERFQKFTNEQVGLGGVMPLTIGAATQAGKDEKDRLGREAGLRFLIQQVNNSNQAVVDELGNRHQDFQIPAFVEFDHKEPILRFLIQPEGSEQNRRKKAAKKISKFLDTFTSILNNYLADGGDQLEMMRVEVVVGAGGEKDPEFSKEVVARAPDRAKSTQLQFDAENIYRIPEFRFINAMSKEDIKLDLDTVGAALETTLDQIPGMRVNEDGGY